MGLKLLQKINELSASKTWTVPPSLATLLYRGRFRSDIDSGLGCSYRRLCESDVFKPAVNIRRDAKFEPARNNKVQTSWRGSGSDHQHMEVIKKILV
jgi:hypothetical protein